MSFEQLRLSEPLLRAIQRKGYAAPTEIQQQAIPHIIDGSDLLGCAQTGTGKTAAFALPIIHRLKAQDQAKAKAEAEQGNKGDNGESGKGAGGKRRQRRPIRCLILSPTRELAAQIGDSFQQYGRGSGLRHTVVFGGVNQGPQCRALRDGVDILIATPGRLMDLLDQGVMTIENISIFVLDEADRMLDMGFIPDIRKIVGMIPDKRQTLLFSATMPKEIQHLADRLLENPVTIKIKAESAAADTVEQSIYFVDRGDKHDLLCHLLNNVNTSRALVFSRTKRGADNIAKKLNRARIAAETIHSDKSQAARQRALKNFKQGKTHVLVATDIAARGIDVDGISHVINFDMPGDAETYVHRIGRTGRAGMEGESISFCTREELGELQSIERLLDRSVNVVKHDFEPAEPFEALSLLKPAPKSGRSRYGKSRRGGGGGGGGSGYAGKKRTGSKYKGNGERSGSGGGGGGGKGKGGPGNKKGRTGGGKHAVVKKAASTKRRP